MASQQKLNESGASMLEYVLLAVLIAVVCIASVVMLGQQSSQSLSLVGSGLNSAQ